MTTTDVAEKATVVFAKATTYVRPALAAALLLVAASTLAADGCTYTTKYEGGKVVQCSTCCIGNNCTTTCL